MPLNSTQLAQKALAIRTDIIAMLVEAGSGHAAGALGMADVFTALYFEVLQHNPKKPGWDDRDRLVLSNGHICPVLYAALAESGYFPRKELLTLRKLTSRLQGHPVVHMLPGIETTSGSLGQGLSQACGMALAAKLKKKRSTVYCVMGDGEQQEGQIWEAYMFAGNHRLGNLTAIIDRNTIQIAGFTEEVAPIEPLRAKLEAFNWHVLEVDGHNIMAVIDACYAAKSITEKPVAIIAHTIPGKGVEFMEGDPTWHGKVPNSVEAKKALRELHTLQGRLNND